MKSSPSTPKKTSNKTKTLFRPTLQTWAVAMDTGHRAFSGEESKLGFLMEGGGFAGSLGPFVD